MITWNNVKLKVGNKTQTLSFVELQSGFPYFGKSYSMNESSDVHAGVSLLAGSASYLSISVTAVTAKTGVSGSANGELKPSGSGSGEVKVTAHWAGCAKPRP